MTNRPACGVSRRSVLSGSAAALTMVAAGACGRPTTAAGPAPRATAGRVPSVRVSRDGFPAHGEPYLAANPREGRNLLGACSVYRGAQRSVATYATFDGGTTWHSNGPLPTGLAGFTGNPTAGNVTVAFDLRGRGFVCAVAGDSQTLRGGIQLWRTDDGGSSFAPPVTAAPGFLDHPGLAADRSAAAAGNLYLAAAYFTGPGDGRLVFCRSTDAGRSFEKPRDIDPGSRTQARLPVIAASPDGTVCVMYFVAMPDGSNLVRVISSQDHGRTFAAPSDLTRVSFSPDRAGVPPGPVRRSPRTRPPTGSTPRSSPTTRRRACPGSSCSPPQIKGAAGVPRPRWRPAARSPTCSRRSPSLATGA